MNKLKKLSALLLAVVMTLSLNACGSQNSSASQPSQNSEQTNTASPAKSAAPSESAGSPTPEESSVPTEKSGDPEKTGSEESGNEKSGSNTLIVFFSPANSDTVDAISSATPRVGGISSVEYVAQLISAKVDADVAMIVPETAYPLPYNDAADQAKQERDNGARPEFTLDVRPEEYDVIFVGYPIWWYEMPMIMQTFFETHDFSGKTIIPFNTHLGSRDGGTYKDIAEIEPNATVLDGFAVSGESADNAESDVNAWLAGLGY